MVHYLPVNNQLVTSTFTKDDKFEFQTKPTSSLPQGFVNKAFIQ